MSGSVFATLCVLRHGFGQAVPLFRDSVYVRDAQYNAGKKKNPIILIMFTNAEYSLEFNSFKALL